MAEPQSRENLHSKDVREVLDAIRELRSELDDQEPKAVARARSEGVSWQEIARRLGRATSSVFERYRDHDGTSPTGRDYSKSPDGGAQ